jgi:hypothetical protein
MRKKDYGWLRLRAAADCGPFFVPDGRLQDVIVSVFGGNIKFGFFCFPLAINNQFRTVSEQTW